MLLVFLTLAAVSVERVEAAADSVEPERLVATLEALGDARVTASGGAARARSEIRERLLSLGHAPRDVHQRVAHTFAGENVWATNLVVDLGGVGAPLYLVAHLDSKGAKDLEDAIDTGWRYDRDPAPGADDDASGVAALVEVARIVKPARRLVLVFSDAEEMARIDEDEFMSNLGIERVVDDAPVEARAIAVDMLLRARPWGASLRVYEDGRASSASLADALSIAAAVVEPAAELQRLVQPAFTYSDHGSFWASGFGAVLLIEDDFHHERYHRPTDRFDRDDVFYSVEQLVAGTRILVAASVMLTEE